MLLAPSLPSDEVDSERHVVLEEIAMYDDEPQDRVHDLLAEAMYGDRPLGRRVLGDAAVIESIPVAEIADYHRERYTAPNLVVAAAGHLDHAEIVELTRRLLTPFDRGAAGPALYASRTTKPRFAFQAKDTEQYHICFGGPGHCQGDRASLRAERAGCRVRWLDFLSAVS